MGTKVIRETLGRLKDERHTQHYESMVQHQDAYDAALEAVREIEQLARSIVESGGRVGLNQAILLDEIVKESE